MTKIVTVRVNERQKELAEINAKKMGLNLSSVCRMLINHLAIKGSIPEELMIPNSDTLQAIADMEKGIGVSVYNSVDDLTEDIGWDK